MKAIKFKGVDYILAGSAITTKERFENGIVSIAHLCWDGTVKQYGKVIGSKDDIEFVRNMDEDEFDMSPTVFLDGMFGDSWD